MIDTKKWEESWKYINIGFRCSNYIEMLERLNKKNESVNYNVLEDARDILSKLTMNAFLNINVADALRIDDKGLSMRDYQRVFLEEPEYITHRNYNSFQDSFDRVGYVKNTLDDVLDKNQNVLAFVVDDLIDFFEKASNKCLAFNRDHGCLI